jgi:hypothetical protein
MKSLKYFNNLIEMFEAKFLRNIFFAKVKGDFMRSFQLENVLQNLIDEGIIYSSFGLASLKHYNVIMERAEIEFYVNTVCWK